jgi:two-component sensor histidine kinase
VEQLALQSDARVSAQDAQATRRPPRRGISISAILALLIAVTILPALIFSVVLLQRNNRAQEAMVTGMAEATAASITQTVERTVSGLTTNLKVFSTARSLEDGMLEQFHDRAIRALVGTGSHLVGLDRNLNEVFNTLERFDAPVVPTEQRNAVLKAFKSGQPTVTGVYQNDHSGQWTFDVILPTDTMEGPVQALILSQSVARLEQVISSQNLRGGWNAAIIDANGVVAASSFMSSDVGKPFFLPGLNEATSAPRYGMIDVNGTDYDVIRSYSESSGWETFVWAQSSVVHGPLKTAMRQLALGGLAILAIGVVLAWVIGRRITIPIRTLARDAHRMGAGESIEAKPFAVAEIATVSRALAKASRSRQESENEIRFLMREVAHRSKNQLTVVSSIAKQTARHARSFAAFEDAFQKRLHGLARSTDLLIAGGAAGVDVRALVAAHIEPFRPSDLSRVTIDGQSFRLSNQAAQTLGLALHELSTNAAKYGAFAGDAGELSICWKVKGDDLVLTWRETVPNLTKQDETRGFGTEVIERMVGITLEARIERELRDDGLHCRFILPIEKLQAGVLDDQNAAAT